MNNLDTIEEEIGHNTLTKKYIEGQIKKMDENNLGRRIRGEEDSGEEDSGEEDGELGKTVPRHTRNQLEHLKKHLDSKLVECQKKMAQSTT